MGGDRAVKYPTMKEVNEADREMLARWYRFLAPGETPEEKKIAEAIVTRFKAKGGMTPALSAKIGHGGV
jgi:hypothetical protein